jgi:hypothetical protein
VPRRFSSACCNTSSTREATSAYIPGSTCEYRSNVIATVAWPSRSCAIVATLNRGRRGQDRRRLSGSPILNQTGAAIGVVVTDQGPHPRLASHLPGGLLRELGLRSRKVITADEPRAPRSTTMRSGSIGSTNSGDHIQRPNIGPVTRSPGAMPSLRAVPAITSRTARTGPPEGTGRSDNGSACSAMRRMRPSLRMKIMSSGM